MTLTWPWGNTHRKPHPKPWRSVYLGLPPSANRPFSKEVGLLYWSFVQICLFKKKSFRVAFLCKKLNEGWEKNSRKNFLHLWTPFSLNDTIFKLIFSDLAWSVTSLEPFNLQARVTPHFKGNFVKIQDLIITPIPQNATSVSFCQIGLHMLLHQSNLNLRRAQQITWQSEDGRDSLSQISKRRCYDFASTS